MLNKEEYLGDTMTTTSETLRKVFPEEEDSVGEDTEAEEFYRSLPRAITGWI